MPDGSLEAEKQPMPSVNAPASGAYGEGAALTRLQDALPPMTPPPATQGAPLPPVSTQPVRPTPSQREGRPPSGAALPPGVPSALLAPTDQPHVPVNTPLASAQPAQQLSGPQQRLQILDLLVNDPNSSDETRAWAQMVMKVLVGG